MHPILHRYATPLTTGLFLVSLVSGAALFFHVGSSWFHGMHEWLSMVLIAPFVFHLWKNWRSFVNYFARPPFYVAMLASLAAALVFVVMPGEGGAGGPPQFAFSHVIVGNPPSAVAPLVGSTVDVLVQRLLQSGFTAASADMPLAEIATKSGKSEFELIAALIAPKP